MAGEKHKEEPVSLWDVLEKYAKYIGAAGAIVGSVSTIVSAVTFRQGDRLASYVFLFVGYLLVAGLLWRVITHKSPVQPAAGIVLPSASQRAELRHQYSKYQRWMSAAGLTVLTALTLGWIGFNVWHNIAPPFDPAQNGEILIIISQFENKGSAEPEVTATQRIYDDLDDAHIEGVRVEMLPNGVIIKGENEARKLGTKYNATLVIWGWFDLMNVAPKYVVIPEPVTATVELRRSPRRTYTSEPDSFGLWADVELPQGMLYLTEFTVGQVHHIAGQYDKALASFNAAFEALNTLQEEKASSWGKECAWGEEYVYFYRGVTQATMGQWPRAMMDYKETIKRDDKFAEAYNNLGVSYSALRDYDRAIENFDLAIRWGLDVAYYNRGNAHYNQGDFEQAIEDYTQSIDRLDSDFIYSAYYNRGLAHVQSQNHEAAIEDYTQAIELAPKKNPDFYLARARSYSELCGHDDALQDLSNVIEKLAASQDARVEALTARGVAYTRLGQYSEALEDYGEALRLNPDYALAHYNLAATKSLHGAVDEAIEALTRAIELNPDLAAIAACDGDFDGIRDHEELPELVPPPEGCPPVPCR